MCFYSGVDKSPGVKERSSQGRTFLVAPDTGARHDLNSLATVIWRQFNEANSVDEIMSLLAAAFPDEVPAKIADDLNDLVEELLRKNLLMPAAMEPYLLQPAQPIRWPRNP
ncbi:MAG: PqqD family protein [Rhodospirillaceae bacterium]|nr:PqqD family protein [Rhodospirillaceae bacterium]MBT4688848.1 PqqD family protein [Rhodospirillaceae bacterium]MBT5079636.1 PqqD family protein [Rhodospirillaceae bacterium]MBT5524681.1 PqqD family protein [Rhodospirillaceae bacterium]MBT6591670.1 PqqD family protein [Rhodospirillaceae bacterium]